MKKPLVRLLMILLLSLAALKPVTAEEANLDLTVFHRFETAKMLCWVENTLYILGENGLYQWQAGMADPAEILSLTDNAEYFYVQECPEDEHEAELWKNAIQMIFTDGKELYGIQPYSGEILKITGQEMSAVAEIPQEVLYSEDLMSYREIKQTAYTGNNLFVLLGTDDYENYSKTELFAFDLQTSSMEPVELDGVQSIFAGPSGKLLALCEEPANQVVQYDVASGESDATPIVLERDEQLCGLVWDEADHRYARLAQGIVKTIDEAGNTLDKAYLPVMGGVSSNLATCSSSGQYASGSGKYIFIRDITGDDPATQLVLHVAGSLVPDLLIQYSIEHPDRAIVETCGSSTAQNAALSGDSNVDLFVLSAPGDFTAAKDKGYIVPLNDDKLRAWASTLYAEIQDVVFNGEDLVAVPITIKVDSWTVDETMWNKLGLGEYPTTYAELFEQIALWLDSYADDYPDYTLSDIQQNGLETLVSAVVKEYIFQNEKSDEPFTFNTDAFRTVMLDIIRNADLLSEEHDQWGIPLLSSYSQGFGISYNDGHRVAMILPPTLDESGEQRMSTDIEVLAVHAASTKKEAAEAFISWYAEHLNTTTRYEMCPEESEPVENPNYPIRLQELQAELESLKQQMETTEDADKQGKLEEVILRKENQIEGLADSQWSISQESIECYRRVAENMRIAHKSAFFKGGGFEALGNVISKFCAKLDESQLEGFIIQLDRVAFMIAQEAM